MRRSTHGRSPLRPTTLARSLALALAPVLALTAAPAGAAGDRDPLWSAKVEGQDPYDGNVWLGDAALDAASGDVFQLFHNADTDQPKRLRRIDGDTGATEWEVGLGPNTSTSMMVTLDPAGERLVVVTEGAGRLAVAHSISTDGTLQWTKDLPTASDLVDLEVNPATGTTCVAGRDSIGGAPRETTWYLGCLDRAGTSFLNRGYVHNGRGGPSRLAVDAARGRWYLAGDVKRVGSGRTRGAAIRLIALDERAGSGWTRTRRYSGSRRAAVGALTVDQATGRVYVGGHRAAPSVRGTLLAYDVRGHTLADRAWPRRLGEEVTDLAVAPGGRRAFAVSSLDRRGLMVRVLNAKGATVRKLRQDPRRADAHAEVAIDPARRLLMVAGVSVATYDWSGRQQWRDTSSQRWVSVALYDADRGRLVVSSSWYDEPGMPGGRVTAWDVTD